MECDLSPEEKVCALKACGILQNNSVQDNLHFHVCKQSDTLTLRANWTTVAEVDHFLKYMNDTCHITWRVLRTSPKDMSAGTRNIFYTQYRCQSSNMRVRSDTKKPHSKHTNCQARMQITVKRIGHRCRSKDHHLPKFPTIIKFLSTHNHAFQCADHLKYKDVSDEICAKFIALFENGHSPMSALDTHKEDLFAEYGDEEYFIHISDRSECPDLQWCYRLYNSIRTSVSGMYCDDAEKESSLLCTHLPEIQKNYAEYIEFSLYEQKPVVAIVTPFMKRIHQKWPYSAELAFVDSTENFDRQQYRVFVLLTHSFIGALPLGIIVTTTEKADAVSLGINMMKKLIGQGAFFGSEQGPKIIIAGHSSSERNGLRCAFPQANVLLCIFLILRSVWRFLYKSENGVQKNDKNEIYHLFKALVYANDEGELQKKYMLMVQNHTMNKYPEVGRYFSDYWNIREEWALCFWKDGVVRVNDTNSYAESAMRILKEKIFHRKRAFNVIQLIDFILTRLDNYYKRKMIDFASGKNVCTQTHYKIDPKKLLDLDYRTISENVHVVINSKKNTAYTVDSSIGICTCYMGINGAPCKHQSFVLTKLKRNSDNSYLGAENEEQRLALQALATGTTANVPPGWYLPTTNDGRIKNDQIVPTAADSTSTDLNFCASNSTSQTGSIEIIEEPCNSAQLDVIDTNADVSIPGDFLEKKLETFEMRIRQVCQTKSGYVATQNFFKHFEKLSTDASIESAFDQFAKQIRKNKRGAIHVQSTSIARRKSRVGGVGRVRSGRPLKRSYNHGCGEHQYAKTNAKRNKAPH
ncbi:uncharacterized protein LOC135844466 [Planococcus citri]|uniref:uncharacterized protein LOC135844466 n=1 Tax=Planococcus citri TaxID=170843 RepID=UPI0031F83919